jgi:transcriptional regulator GlxA family with amidase domain
LRPRPDPTNDHDRSTAPIRRTLDDVDTQLNATATAAIVVYQGVLVDETEVFRFVLSRLPGLRTVVVGATRATVAGPGGVETAEATLEEVGNPQIIAVPGGIGCHRRVEIADWLRTVSPRWILASSTGSTLLAVAGLLRDATAATHWLAGDILERYGAHASHEQVVVDGSIVTCSGSASAFRAALVVAEAYGGRELARRIHAEAVVAVKKDPPAHVPAWRRLWNALRTSRHELRDNQTPMAPALKESEVLDLGLITLHPQGDHTSDT